MLFTPRIHQLSHVPDKQSSAPSSPYLQLLPSARHYEAARRQALNMLLVHQTGSVKVGELMRYAQQLLHSPLFPLTILRGSNRFVIATP